MLAFLFFCIFPVCLKIFLERHQIQYLFSQSFVLAQVVSVKVHREMWSCSEDKDMQKLLQTILLSAKVHNGEKLFAVFVEKLLLFFS